MFHRSLALIQVLTIVAFVAGISVDSAKSAESIIGTWVGNIVQPGHDPYKGVMILLENGVGTSAYPTLNCGGILRGVERGGVYRFTETITYGHADDGDGDCIDGTIEMSVRGETMRWTWSGSWEGEAITASGVLTRTGRSKR